MNRSFDLAHKGNAMKTLKKSAAIFSALVSFCLLLAAHVPLNAQQQTGIVASANNVQLVIEGKVISVHDGDTVTVLDQDNKKFTIRLQGIDAPELKQEFGAASQKNLSGMVLGKQVTILWNKVDKYRRTVGTIMLDGHDVNIEQVKAGVAWHFKKYEDEQPAADRITYAAAEQSARAAKLGLWKAENPLAPGDWRQEVKTKRWGPPPPAGTIIGNSNSKKYHRPDCSGYRDMAEKNRVFFKSVEEAEAAGYKRAGNCPAEVAAIKATKVSSSNGSASSTTILTKPAPATTTSSTVPVAVTTTVGSAASTDVQAKVLDTSSSQKTIGNKNSKIFHLPGCSGYDRVSEKNRVYFNSAAEAEAAGYKRAGNCKAEAAAATTIPATPSSGSATSTTVTTTTPSTTESPAAPVTRTTTTGSAATSVPPGKLDGNSSLKTIGNKNSKIFHLPGCSGYDRVSEKNRVYFNSAAEAESAGYRIAKNCSAASPN
jgi:endonuclease YncB( thermonuclease family)/methylphosphotriester-DNA--protein-cysteine methyltransferase